MRYSHFRSIKRVRDRQLRRLLMGGHFRLSLAPAECGRVSSHIRRLDVARFMNRLEAPRYFPSGPGTQRFSGAEISTPETSVLTRIRRRLPFFPGVASAVSQN